MGENIIWIMFVWICAAWFTGIGIYAGKKKEPMAFWTGTVVPAESVRDIPAYNRASKRMWLMYSSLFWISGPLYIWYPNPAFVILMTGCTVGIIWLIWYYKRIEKRYVIK